MLEPLCDFCVKAWCVVTWRVTWSHYVSSSSSSLLLQKQILKLLLTCFFHFPCWALLRAGWGYMPRLFLWFLLFSDRQTLQCGSLSCTVKPRATLAAHAGEAPLSVFSIWWWNLKSVEKHTTMLSKFSPSSSYKKRAKAFSLNQKMPMRNGKLPKQMLCSSYCWAGCHS